MVVAGTLATAARREEILHIAAEELDDIPVQVDLVLVSAAPPSHDEELA